MVDRQFWTDLHWGEEHHTELLKTYRDKWVAVFNKQIVSAGLDLSKVRQEAQEKTGRKDFPVLFVDCGQHIYGQN